MLNCSDKPLDVNLENGLKNYRKVRHINESFLKGYTVKKLAFFKTDSVKYKFVIQLNNNVIEDTVANYSLGMVVFADKKYMPDEKQYLVWGMHPTLEKKGDNKYIIKNVETPIKYMDSMHVFLYARDGYKGTIGRMIKLKNIKL